MEQTGYVVETINGVANIELTVNLPAAENVSAVKAVRLMLLLLKLKMTKSQ